MAQIQYKPVGSEERVEISGDSFTIDQNGSYFLILTDHAGNETWKSFTVSGIDAEPPQVALTSSIPGGWQPAALGITFTVADGGSGVRSVQTAFTESQTVPADTALESQPAEQGTYTLTAQNPDQRYLYYRVTDEVGNSADGFFGPIYVDTQAPSLQIQQPETLAAQQEQAELEISVQSGASGAELFYSTDGNDYTELSPGTLTLTAPGTYYFQAVSGAGTESAVQTAVLHQVRFASAGDLPARLILEGGQVIQPEDPARTGYRFTGWQKGGAAYTFSTPVTESFTLAAAWELEAPGLTLSASYAGGQGDGTYNKGDLVFTAQPDHPASGIQYTYQWLDAAGTPVAGATEQSFTLPAANAGEYRYACQVAATDSEGLYSTATRSTEAAIAKAPVEFAVSNATQDYDTAEKAAAVTPSSQVEGLTVGSGDYAVRYEQNGQTVTPVNVGSYGIFVSLQNDNLTFAGESDEVREKQVGTLEIRGVPYPAAGTMTWPEAAALTYGQTLGESALTGGDQAGQGSYAWQEPSAIPTVNNTGYTVVFTPADGNYAPVEHTVTVTVAPRELTLAGVTAQGRDYEPENTAVTLSGGSLEGIVSRNGAPDEVTPDAAKAQGRLAAPDAGENLAVTVSGYALTGADAANYTLRQPDYVTVTITPAEGAATLTMESWTYGETPARPVAESATNGTDAVTYHYTGTLADGVTPYDSADRPSDAGSYQMEAVFAATNNYQAVTKQAAFTIEKAPVEFAVSNATQDYDTAEKAAAVTPSSQVEGLTVGSGDYAVRYEQNGQTVTPVNAGSYGIFVSLQNDNLTFAGESDEVREKQVGTLEIRGVSYPAAGTMTWPEAAALTYGQTLGESALTGGDQAGQGSYAWQEPSAIPTVNNTGYTVVFTPADGNYAPVEHTVTVTVAPRELTLAGVTAQGRDYEPENTTVTLSGGSLEGIVSRNGAPDAVAPDAAKAQGRLAAPDAGENLAVTVSGYALTGADAANYTLRQPDYVTVTITPAEGTATLTMESWTYGETPAQPVAESATNGTDAVTYRYTGTLADGVTPYDSADPPVNAGSYQVEAVFAATNNYQAVTKQAAFTIEKAPVPAPEADETAFVYNGQDQTYAIAPDARYTVSGNTQRDAGSYTVTVALGDKANYQWADGDTEDKTYPFTMEKRAVTATWNQLDLVYNAAAQAPAIAGLIGVLEADAGRVEALAGDNARTAAGSYSALARLTGEQAHNYTLQNAAASFTIRPAPVVFRVENNSARYDGQPHAAQVTAQALGQAFDGFTVTYQTMDGGETAAPVEAGRYRVLAAITDPNYRHSDGADNAARQIGVLEIYQAAAPGAYSIAFLPGAEDAAGSPPALPESLAGSIHILPAAGGLERPGYRFAGWRYEGNVYSAGSAFVMPARDVELTAVWAETSYEIDGSVVWEDETGESAPQPVEDVLVTLMRGNERIAQTQTGPDGGFSFQQVSAGLYNLVATYGEIVQTQKVELIDRDQNQCVIQLPRGNTNSVLKVLDGAPPVVVGNLDRVFTAQPDEVYTEEDRQLVENGGTVEVRMTVAQTSPAADSPLNSALETLTGGFREGLTLDLTMGKTREDADGAALGREAITESNLLIEVVIPLNGALQNCRGYRVLRQHEGAVDEIGTEANQWGEYFTLNESRTTLTIFARQFSLYSILYSNLLPAQPDDGGTSATKPEEPTPAVTPAATAADAPAVKEEEPAEKPAKKSAALETEPPLAEPETQPEEDTQDAPEPVKAEPDGMPFILLNAAASLLGVLLAVFTGKRGKKRLPAAVCAAGALAVTILTTGWNGVALVNIWTIPVVALVLLAAGFSRRAQTPMSKEER